MTQFTDLELLLFLLCALFAWRLHTKDRLLYLTFIKKSQLEQMICNVADGRSKVERIPGGAIKESPILSIKQSNSHH